MRGGAAPNGPLRRLRTIASRPRARAFSRSLRSGAGQPVSRAPALHGRPRMLPAISSTPTAFTECRVKLRSFATVADGAPHDGGPLEEYDRRVEDGLLRNDEHQRGTVVLELSGPERWLTLLLQVSSRASSISTTN